MLLLPLLSLQPPPPLPPQCINKVYYHFHFTTRSLLTFTTMIYDRPCILAQCLFSDTYIYSAGDPTYVHTLPLIGSSRVGDTSTIHQDQVGQHRDGFDAIDRVTHELNNNPPAGNISLPFYLTALRPPSH